MTGPFIFEITGYAGCGSSCKTTWSPEYNPETNMDDMIVDSGTVPDIVIPNPDLSTDVELTITAGTASLTFPVADVMIGGQPFISEQKVQDFHKLY